MVDSSLLPGTDNSPKSWRDLSLEHPYREVSELMSCPNPFFLDRSCRRHKWCHHRLIPRVLRFKAPLTCKKRRRMGFKEMIPIWHSIQEGMLVLNTIRLCRASLSPVVTGSCHFSGSAMLSRAMSCQPVVHPVLTRPRSIPALSDYGER